MLVQQLLYNQISLMKIIILCLLVAAASCTYNATLAKKLSIASGAAFATDAEISQWSCKVCSGFPLVRTKAFSNPILDIYGFTGYSEQEGAIVISFRGTVNVQNWIANLDANQVKFPGCSGCLIHQGFYNAFESVQGYIRKDIQALVGLYRGAKIYVTGFSSGGSLATVAALDIKQIFGKVDQFYSFGQSRVGNQAFATFFTEQINQRFRVIHYADIVPHVPPQIPIPYSHFSSQIWYDEAMSKYKVCGAEEFTCCKSLFPNQWSISDTDITAYMKIVGAMQEII